MKFILGTAQFGSDYGISNRSGELKSTEATKILTFCRKTKIQLIDTAPGYGESENILGQNKPEFFKFITKIPKIEHNQVSISKFIFSCIHKSLRKLRISKLYAVLIHNPEDLIKGYSNEAYNILSDLKQKGLVEKIGVSVYTVSELEAIQEKYKLDIVQLPLSIFDQSFLRSGWLKQLANNSIEVHVRSIFLQGLLLTESKNLDKEFSKWNNVFGVYKDWLKELNISALEACIRTVLSVQNVDHVLVGVQNVNQLKQICYFSSKKPLDMPQPFFDYDENFLNPSKWKK